MLTTESYPSDKFTYPVPQDHDQVFFIQRNPYVACTYIHGSSQGTIELFCENAPHVAFSQMLDMIEIWIFVQWYNRNIAFLESQFA